jgi:hypothetical protein
MAKGKINTPFQAAGPAPSTGGNSGAVMNHNRTPILGKPHSTGPDTIPLKFGEGGKALEPNPAKFKTPFGTALEVKGTKKGV